MPAYPLSVFVCTPPCLHIAFWCLLHLPGLHIPSLFLFAPFRACISPLSVICIHQCLYIPSQCPFTSLRACISPICVCLHSPMPVYRFLVSICTFQACISPRCVYSYPSLSVYPLSVSFALIDAYIFPLSVYLHPSVPAYLLSVFVCTPSCLYIVAWCLLHPLRVQIYTKKRYRGIGECKRAQRGDMQAQRGANRHKGMNSWVQTTLRRDKRHGRIYPFSVTICTVSCLHIPYLYVFVCTPQYLYIASLSLFAPSRPLYPLVVSICTVPCLHIPYLYVFVIAPQCLHIASWCLLFI